MRFLVVGFLAQALTGTASSADFRVRDFGAKGDGVTKDTAAVQTGGAADEDQSTFVKRRCVVLSNRRKPSQEA